MAELTVAGVNNLMEEMRQELVSCIEYDEDDELSMLFEKAPEFRVKGEGASAIVPLRTLAGGGIGLMTETNNEYPLPEIGQDAEGSFGVVQVGLSFNFSRKLLDMLDNGGDAKEIALSLADLYEEGVSKFQAVRRAERWGKGDGVVGRANAANTSTASKEFKSSIPVLAVEGEVLVGYKQSAWDGDERSMAAADSGSSYVYTVAPKVEKVDLENNTIWLATACKWTNDTVLVRKSTTSTNKTWANGLLNHFDCSAPEDSSWWDTDDLSSYKYTSTYGTLARATYKKLNSFFIAGNGAALKVKDVLQVLDMLRHANCRIGDAVLIMNSKTRREVVMMFTGGMKVVDSEVQLALGKKTLPCLTGTGHGQVPFIDSGRCPENCIIACDKSQFVQLTLDGGWEKVGGDRLLPLPGTNNWKSTRVANYRAYRQDFYQRPYRAVIKRGFTIPS